MLVLAAWFLSVTLLLADINELVIDELTEAIGEGVLILLWFYVVFLNGLLSATDDVVVLPSCSTEEKVGLKVAEGPPMLIGGL